MKKIPSVIALLALTACSKSEPSQSTAKSSAPAAAVGVAAPGMSEKDKALANPYPNDLGPDRLSETVLSGYPADIRKGYGLLLIKCAQCHSPARPLNSRFSDAATWNRYVKRMMNKPGCAIAPAEGKAIWQFLSYDSEQRKHGVNANAWEAHRKKLIAAFKAKNPKRYAELFAAGDL